MKSNLIDKIYPNPITSVIIGVIGGTIIASYFIDYNKLSKKLEEGVIIKKIFYEDAGFLSRGDRCDFVVKFKDGSKRFYEYRQKKAREMCLTYDIGDKILVKK